MKILQTISTAAAICSAALFFSGCDKDDATPPKLTMNGEELITINLNSPFNDPGVTAADNEDGSITVTSDASATNPDVNKTGTYYIHYSVSDAAGNKSKTMRTVVVRNSSESLSGAYYVTGTCATGWIDGIIPSTTVNNRITFTQFGRYTNANGKLSAGITNDLGAIVPATINCGTIPVNRNFTGDLILTAARDTIYIYTEEITATDTTSCSYMYVKQ